MSNGQPDRLALLESVHAELARAQTLLGEHQQALAQLQATLARDASLRRVVQADDDVNGLSMPASLTPRQREILGYLGDGLNTRQIAERLWLSRATVRNHVS